MDPAIDPDGPDRDLAAPASAPAFSRAELEDAFAHYQAQVQVAADTGDWGHFSALFAEDATYVEHAFGSFTGRTEIDAWVRRTMGAFPGNLMTSFPIAWSVVDEPTGRIICEVRNLMPDPGDGSAHEASNLTILTYGGDGLWACEEDVYNPMRFAEMATAWAAIAARHGRLPEDGEAFVARLTPGR